MTLEELKGLADALVVIADQDGFITFVRGDFSGVLGWESGELLGKSITVLMPKRFRDAHNLGFARFLMTEQPTLLNRPLNLKVLTKDGEELDSEHVIIAEKTGGRWVFGTSIRPTPAPKNRGKWQE